ncbi:hypothetical protein CgunFtcFv8_025576 [Champsocephalus gunnari]|uniref:Uncharacterized protein n=1 Tax=Champsocephalus gunnari TaxID=52237 RepID=A0AAN8CBS0_CHAGU|nr:hypothetical protein CgunFtcFv8_025576 [Champsocephalus gunnari]
MTVNLRLVLNQEVNPGLRGLFGRPGSSREDRRGPPAGMKDTQDGRHAGWTTGGVVTEAPAAEVSGSCRKSWDPPAANSSGP